MDNQQTTSQELESDAERVLTECREKYKHIKCIESPAVVPKKGFGTPHKYVHIEYVDGTTERKFISMAMFHELYAIGKM
jgi:hypothetical protein